MTDSPRLARLAAALDAEATAVARAFWARLTRGALPSRGCPDVLVRTRMHAWWKAEGLPSASRDEQRATALGLLARGPIEDKLAGIHALAEILLPHLGLAGLAELERVLAAGALPDSFPVDFLAVRVLAPMAGYGPDPAPVVRALAAWADSPSPWVRRAGALGISSAGPGAPRRAPRPGGRPRRHPAG